jgi:hypothetical protein
MRSATLARSLGTGLLAGLAGTAAMSLSNRLEERVLGRHSFEPPAETAKKALGIERFETPAAEARFDTLARWGYGAGWGLLHGALRAVGVRPVAAGLGLHGAVWGSALALLPAHDVAPPVFMRPRRDVAAELWHHVVYAAATGIAYERIARQ